MKRERERERKRVKQQETRTIEANGINKVTNIESKKVFIMAD